MKVSMSIDYDVQDADPEVEEALEEAIAQEAQVFVGAVRHRLAAEGVTDIRMSLSESKT